ncbi:MAG: Dabb family protein [Pirellulaceae bacterium]|nr:Dabb family protein [Pirellulaceae bacterium]
MKKARRNDLRLASLMSLGLLAFALTGAVSATEKGDAVTETKAKNLKEERGKFVHLFYFKFKEDVPDEEIAELMKELVNSTKKIPVVKEFMVGKNVARRTHGFQYGEIAIFEKKADLKIFERHPEHQKLVRKILPKLVHGVSMDFVPIDGDALAEDHISTASDASEEKPKSPKQKFIHAFCFKFKNDAPEEEVAGLMQELAHSKEHIPVLQEFMVGKNVARNGHGFQYGEIAVFDNKEDLEVFERHPEHRKLVPKIIPHLEMGIAMDFEPIEN